MATIPAYTINGFTRPELILDGFGNIVLDDTAAAFAQAYGLKALYIGCPPSTPFPPVLPSLLFPTDTNGAPNTVAEGAAANTTVGITAHATSILGFPVTYSLTADSSGGGFQINATTGVVSVLNPGKIDFESNPGHSYSITVRANDGILTRSQTFTIGVSDVAPSTPADANAAANTVAEGAANGTAVGLTVAATDVNGGTVTYSLTDNANGAFAINATTGVVTVADSTKIDFETAVGHAYTVVARASDPSGASTTQTFTIGVSDVAPSTPVDSDAAANTVAEGAANGSTVGITASSVDPNGPATTYALTDSAGGRFAIDPGTGVVTVANGAAIDFETAAGHAYGIIVQATSGASSTTQAFAIGVTDVGPSTPVDINGAADSVSEGAANGTVVGITASSTDPGGGPAPTYSLTDNAGGRFAIDPTTGIVTVANGAAIDFETATGHAYGITVQTQAGALTSTQNFSIGVSDVAPSTPADADVGANTVAEGAANGTAVGLTVSATDVNGGTVTYSLTDNANGAFAINATTGVVTVADSTKIDFETAVGHAYTVTAQASDGTLVSSTQTFTIDVADVAPSTPTDSDNAANTVAEGAVNGSSVGLTASSIDPNGPATTYVLTDSAGGRFAIDPGTGVVTVANGAAIDFETAAGHAYGITVQATSGALSTTQAFAIGVTDVAPSTPADINGAADSVFEGTANGTVVGITASSTDPGGGPAPTYSLTDNAGGRFAIDPTTGIVTVANGAAIDFETAAGHAYDVTVQATAGALSTTHTFSIGVGDVNEAPAGADKAVLIAEDTTYTFGVADFGFSDPSDSLAPNSLLAVKITTVPGAGEGTLTNNGVTVNAGDSVSAADIATGHLVFTPVLNANGSPEATFTFQVQDDGGTANGGVDLDQSANTFTINVNAGNDAPINSVPGTQAVNEEATLTFSTGTGNAITISDVDVGSGDETVTLTVAHGTLALGSTAGLSAVTNNAASISLTGTIANVNAALNGLTYTGDLNFHGTDTLIVDTNDHGNTGTPGPRNDSDNVIINVSDVADTPSVTNATTNEDTQSASGLVVSRNATDGTDVAFFKITGITNGTLFQSDGVTAISNGDFISFAQANAGLKFTPAADFFGNGSFNVQASTSNTNAGLGGSPATATITVNPVADTPSVTNATTNEDIQSAAGLVVSHNAVDGAEVGFVKITGITNGTLFQNDGTTAISNGDFISFAQANAGLKFTPAADFFGNGSFDVQASTSNTDAGLGGSVQTATITVNAVADTPSVTGATTNEDTQSASGLVVSHNPVDGAEVGFVKITAIANGTLFQNDGTTAINDGDFITYAQANAGLKFTPAADFFGNGSFNVQASTSNTDAGLGGSVQTATITVDPVNDAPNLTSHDRDPVYAPGGVQLFDTTHVDVGPANESAQNIKQLVLTVSNVDGTGTTDHLSIDGTDVFLTDGNTAVGANHGVSIAVAFAGGTATVTISKPIGDIPAADVASIVDGLTYTNDDVTGGEAMRHITLTSIQDDGGGTAPNVDARTLTIDSTVNFNIAPTVTAGGTLTYTENATSLIDNTITITDPDNPTMSGAKVAITTGFDNTQDVLNFTPGGGITGSYNASTGVLTLTGTATQAQYETVLESVTYQNTSDNPSTTQRTVSYTVNDGSVDSAPGTATINVNAVNDAPAITPTGGSTAYIENAAAVTVDGLLTVTDPDSSIISAQVRVSAGFQTGDSLNFVDQNGITGIYAAGVLALSGTASVADYQTALRSITFSSTNNDPGVSKTIEFKVNDAVVDSNLATKTLAITPVNDEPTLTATANGGGAVTFTETSNPASPGSGPVDLFSTPIASTVEAGQTVTQVVLTVTNVADTTEYLTIGATAVDLVNGNSEAVTVGGAAGTATVSILSGTATITVTPTTPGTAFTTTQVNTLVDNLAYNNDDNTPTATTHTISVTSLTDSGANGGVNNDDNTGAPSVSTVVTVVATNDAPVNSVPGAQTFNEDTSRTFNTANGNLISISDADAGSNPVEVTLTSTKGAVSLSGIAGLAFSAGDGSADTTMTFTGTIADINTALNGLVYAPTLDANGTAQISITTNDQGFTGSPGAQSDTDAITLNITAVNDAPANNGVPGPFTVMSGFTHAITGLTISDVDANEGGTATDITTTLTSAGGAFVTVGAIGGGAVITNNGTGAVTLTGSIAQINTSLAGSVVYTAADNITTSQLTTLTIATNDHGHTGTPGAITDTDVISVGVTPQVWFIDIGQTISDGTAPRGSQANPFTDIHEFNTSSGPGANDYIYLKAGTYTGEGIDLKPGQTLLGDDQALSLADPFGGPAIVIEPATGARPTIHVTSGQGIDLSTGNTVAGIDIQTDAGTTGLDDGQGAGGNAVGTLNVSHMAISGAGQAVDIDQGGAVTITLDSLSSSGGAEGVQLAGTASSGAGLLSGTFSGGTGAISGSTTAGFLVGDGGTTAGAGGTVAITYNGTVTTSGTVHAVDIQDRAASAGNIGLGGTISHASGNGSSIFLDQNAAGTITFSGANSVLNSGTTDAVHLTNNTGATINFTGGGLDIDATSGAGFLATGGGTVGVSGSNNSITTTTGTALNVSNTTIGAGGVTFHDVSSNGAASGIVLNNTGSGGFTVTGDGGSSSNHSGGTINASTGAGVSLTSTGPVSLNYLDVTNSGTDGVNASGVNGFTLTRSNVTDTAGGAADEGLQLTNMTGTITLTNDLVSGSPHNNLFLQNNNTNLTAVNITNSTFQNNLAGTGADGVLIEAQGTSVINAITIKGSTFSGNKSTGLQVQTEDTANIQNLAVGAAGAGNGNTFSGNNAGVDFDVSQTSDLTFSLINNSFQNNRSQAINVFTATASLPGASVTGKIQNNVIGTQGTLDSGSAIGSGIRVVVKGGTHGEFTIDGNQIHEVANARAIDLEGFHTASGGGGADFNVINNIVFQPTGTNQSLGGGAGVPLPLASIWISSDNETGASGDEVVRAVVSGNTVYDPRIWVPDSGGEAAIYLQGNNFGGINAHLQIEGTGSVLSTIATNNTISNNNGANKNNSIIIDGNVALIAPGTSGPFPLLAGAGGIQATSPTPGETHLTQAQLDSIVAAAIGQWAAAGASAAQLAAMHATIFSIGDLSGNIVGEQTPGNPGHIVIDTDAGGHGWFVDTTPGDNSEFTHAANAAGTDLFTDPTNAAAGHLDLLTTVTHELGHVLGMPDLTAASDVNDLMYIDLVDGERRLPDAADVPVTNTTPLTPNVALAPVVTPTMVQGTAGNDVIDAGHGGKTLVGGLGADNFVFANVDLHAATPPPLTHVADYSFAQGDTFDFSALTSQFHYANIADASLLRVVEDASGTFATLQLNTSAATRGGANWTTVAQLDGAHAGDDVGVLIDSNAAVHVAHLHAGLLV